MGKKSKRDRSVRKWASNLLTELIMGFPSKSPSLMGYPVGKKYMLHFVKL